MRKKPRSPRFSGVGATEGQMTRVKYDVGENARGDLNRGQKKNESSEGGLVIALSTSGSLQIFSGKN